MKIVFTKSKKRFPLFSWFVRLYQGTEYSHVALETSNGLYYYQASEGKVNKEYYAFFLNEHTIVSSYEIPDIDLEPLEQQLGRNYGTIQNVGIVLVDIVRLFKQKLINNPLSQDVNCSEFIYRMVIVPLFGEQGYDADYVKPKHIEQIMLKLSNKP